MDGARYETLHKIDTTLNVFIPIVQQGLMRVPYVTIYHTPVQNY